MQLIDGSGKFNDSGLDSFVKSVRLPELGLSYVTVSIMGPQSSGKSTLLNHLFGTKFREMDAFKGRTQTTQGVWLAKANGIEPSTFVLDLEGTDGCERGDDDTCFEKQSSLFALAISDILLINMWCHDIGREHAANRPLLETVFQVMMRLFTPRKTTLLFVIRDKTKTPLEVLDPVLREDVEKIWASVPKPEKFNQSRLSDFFQVEVTALASYEEKEELFRSQVDELRQRFMHSVGDRTTVVPGSGFSLSTQEIWKVIKANRDLDLPAHKVMVAAVRCEEIANEQFLAFTKDEEWKDLSEAAKCGPVSGFGKRLDALMDRHFSSYDAETTFFEASVRDCKREFLVSRCLKLVQPAYLAVLGHHRAKAFALFKQSLDSTSSSTSGSKKEGFAESVRRCTEECLREFDQGCADSTVIKSAGWDSSKVKEKLRRDVESYASTVRAQRLSEVVSRFQRRLEEALGNSVSSLLEAASSDTWPSVRKLLSHETGLAKEGMLQALTGFEPLDRSKIEEDFVAHSRIVVENKAREEASQVLIRMKDRFNTVFSHDDDHFMPRVWKGKDDIRSITLDARRSALKLLSVLCVLRLDGNSFDNVEATLTTLLGDQASTSSELAASSWKGVSSNNMLLSPVSCNRIWRQFKAETEYKIAQALAAQDQANKRGGKMLPPLWAIAVMMVLGYNEFMALIRNPLYLVVILVLYPVGKALHVGRGLQICADKVSGLISVSAKLLSVLMNILKWLSIVDAGQRLSG